MKAALVALALLAAACHSQDAALEVTFTGQYLIPGNANLLQVDVLDSGVLIVTRNYPLTTPFPQTLTLVRSGTLHQRVVVNATLRLSQNGQIGVVGLGSAQADLVDGQTENVTVTLVPPQ